MDTFWPFFADGYDNYALIIKHIIKNDEQDITNWFYGDDLIVIIDRGFRNVVDSMEELGFQVKIPTFLKDKK